MIIMRILGKETLATQLVISFCNELKKNERILLVDTICGKRLIPIEYGVEDETIYDIYDYFNGVVDFYKSLVEVDEKLGIIASSYLEDKLNSEEIKVGRLYDDAAEDYDKIIVLANDATKSWEFGDDCINVQIYSKDNSISDLRGINKIVVDNTENILSDSVHLQELKWFGEMGLDIVGIIENENVSQKIHNEILQNILSNNSVDIKPRGFFNRVKEVFK